MCGRFAITLPPEAMIGLFDLAGVSAETAAQLRPRYNVSPSQLIPVCAVGQDGTRKLIMMRFGLHPAWMKEPPGAKSMINARAETAAEKPFFREAMKKRRCLIPADGFYEWRRVGQAKTPFFIRRRDGAPMVFAGLWERWGQGDAMMLTAAMLTIGPNAVMAPIHDRMPVILAPADFDLWLRTDNSVDAVARLLAPAADDVLEAYEVSRAVNAARNEGPELIRPAP